MNSKTIFRALFSALLLTACGSADVYDSSVTERASLLLSVEWEKQQADIPQPAEYTVLLPGVRSLQLSANSSLLEQLPTGATQLLLFNVPKGMSADGSVVGVSSGDNGISGDIGRLFTAASDVYIKPNAVTDVHLKMKQRTRQICFHSPMRDDISAIGVKMEVASKLDVEYNRLFDTAPLTLELTPDAKRTRLSGDANILGITGASLDIYFSIGYAARQEQLFLLSIPPDAFGHSSGIASPLTITLHPGTENYQAEIASDAGHWQLQMSEITIDNNDQNSTLQP